MEVGSFYSLYGTTSVVPVRPKGARALYECASSVKSLPILPGFEENELVGGCGLAWVGLDWMESIGLDWIRLDRPGSEDKLNHCGRYVKKR